MSYPPYRNARRDFDADPQLETWENEGGYVAPEREPQFEPLVAAMIEEFWQLQAEADLEPAGIGREIA